MRKVPGGGRSPRRRPASDAAFVHRCPHYYVMDARAENRTGRAGIHAAKAGLDTAGSSGSGSMNADRMADRQPIRNRALGCIGYPLGCPDACMAVVSRLHPLAARRHQRYAHPPLSGPPSPMIPIPRASLPPRVRPGLILILLLALFGSSRPVGAAPQAIQLLPCTDLLGCIEYPAGATVLVGGLHDFSTYVSHVGTEQFRGASLAVQNFGSLLGHPVEYRALDTRCDVATARRLVEVQQAETALLGFVGATCNDVTQELILPVSGAGTVLIAPHATRPAFTGPGAQPGSYWQPGFYSTVSSDLHQGIATAHFARHNLGIRRLVVIGDGSQDSAYLSEVMSRAFQIQGGHVLEHRIMPSSDTGLNALLEHLSTLQPTAVYLPVSHQHALRFLQKVRGRTAFQTFPMLASASWLEADVAQAVRNSHLTLYATGWKPRSQGAQAFTHSWHVAYGEMPRTMAGPQAFDAVTMLLHAARLVAVADDRGNVSIGRLALRQALSALKGFPGVSGVLSCSATGYCGADDIWSIFQFTTGPALAATWPPVLVQHSRPPIPVHPVYQGRSISAQNILEGPRGDFPQVGILQADEIYRVRQISPDRAWYNLQAGGWIPTSALELYALGLPEATFLPPWPVTEEATPAPLQVGEADWPIPFRAAFEAADEFYVTLTHLLRDGDRDYANTVPSSRRIAASCPHCGHVGLRIALENKGGEDRTVSIHDFRLRLVRPQDGLPETIPAAALKCRLNRFRNDRVIVKPFVGAIVRDLCFAVPDTSRVAWFYTLTYAPAAADDQASATAAETLHFSLQ